MIKNLVFDIGGILLDDGKENLRKFLEISAEDTKKLYKIVYGSKDFRHYLVGRLKLDEYIEGIILKNPEQKEFIEKLLSKENLPKTMPIKNDILNVLRGLKKKHKIYFLSNLTKDTYLYIKNILGEFNGGIYSFKAHICKPDTEIYLKLIKEYNLKKEETIFFDDRQKNVDIGNSLGIKSVKFNNIDDIINAI